MPLRELSLASTLHALAGQVSDEKVRTQLQEITAKAITTAAAKVSQ